jgi:hypothetical protein
MWKCPECSEEGDLDPDAEVGQILERLECEHEFEIQSLEPLVLQVLVTHNSEAVVEAGAEADDEDEEEG